MLKGYIKEIKKIYERGDAREESYYNTVKLLIEGFSKKLGKNDIAVTILPKATEAGNPDLRIWKGKNQITGYIEAKKPQIEDLNKIEKSEQLRRYREAFPNLILTNFLEFRLYREGRLIDKVEIIRPFDVFTLKTVYTSSKKEKEFENLMQKFLSFSLPQTYTPESLAAVLAKKTRFLKEIVLEEIADNEQNILGFYSAFKKFLIFELTKDDFADLYSQTITYGLFAARMRTKNAFNRREAFFNIPQTFGILRDIFRFISLEDIPTQMKYIIEDITAVLAAADVKDIFERYYHEKKGKDPVVYFYETFLSVYDPKERERRGVYYTPEPVVKYIVSSLNIILKEKLNVPDGFSDPEVTVLDPAAGTLSFIAEAIKLAVDEFTDKYGEGNKNNFIKEHILKDFYAFELMMAPYAVGHIKMSFLLDEEGYKLGKNERPKFYLTNTLEMKELAESGFPGMRSLSDESHLAGKVKREIPILVIMGNPPYSGISVNKGRWISEKIEDYKYIEGKYFGEKKHWLQDDYVKFIRFAQWKIDQAGEGVIGFITNHSYLDNPTFRGMRYSLLKSFDEMYILNLHGNSLKKEKCPNGGKDENVFDIRQGVAVSFFIKKKGYKGDKKLFYSDLFGERSKKYKYLLENNINTTEWKELSPHKEYFFFVSKNEKAAEIYKKFWKVTDIFPINVTGIVTARDKFVIDFDKNSLEQRIRMFKDLSIPDDLIRETFKLKNTRGWKLKNAREKLFKENGLEKYFTKILYRPFDSRWIFYTRMMVDWGRQEVMQHMMKENLSICFMRQVSLDKTYTHFFVSDNIVNNRAFSSSKGIIQQAPLYLYPSSNKNHLFENIEEKKEKVPNLNTVLLEELKEAYKKELIPEEVFYYIYGVLYSNIYRTKYAEFLKIDFPKVPFTSDYGLFKKMGELGRELTDLHLLKSRYLGNPTSKFEGKGSTLVEKVRYNEEEKRVYINKEKYFTNVDKDVWEYQIGGYQVLNKWLKYRKGRYLSLSETTTYVKIATALQKTIAIQQQIDVLYPYIEKEIITFNN